MMGRIANFILPRMRLIKHILYNRIKNDPKSILASMGTREIFSLQREPLCKGFSIGMFWAFVPMPLQMVPATLFCWLGRANLPIALLAVWISNPLTYIPILYLEYKIGLWFFYSDADDQGFEIFADGSIDMTLVEMLTHLVNSAESVILPLIFGSIVLSFFMAAVGYGLGFVVYEKLKRRQ